MGSGKISSAAATLDTISGVPMAPGTISGVSVGSGKISAIALGSGKISGAATAPGAGVSTPRHGVTAAVTAHPASSISATPYPAQ